MAKKIRFPLEMDNGVQVRTLEELKADFSLEKVLGYFLNGKLTVWLCDRYYTDIADKLQSLDANDPELAQKICELFDVSYTAESDMNMESILEKNERISRLKAYSNDAQVVDAIDSVAFDQDELYDLLDRGCRKLYLCGERFVIPLNVCGVEYTGVNSPVVVIESREVIDLAQRNIKIRGCVFDEAYQKLIDMQEKDKAATKMSDLEKDFCNLTGDDLVSRLEQEIADDTALSDKARYMLATLIKYSWGAYNESKYSSDALFKTAAENGYTAAVIRYGIMTYENPQREELYKNAVDGDLVKKDDWNDPFVVYEYAICCLNLDGYKEQTMNYLKKSSEMGFWKADISMGFRYEDGDIVSKSYEKANECYLKASRGKMAIPFGYIADNYYYQLSNISKAEEYYRKAAQDKYYCEGISNRILEKALKPISKNYKRLELYCPYRVGTYSEVNQLAKSTITDYIRQANKQVDANGKDFLDFCREYTNDFRAKYRNMLVAAFLSGKIASLEKYETIDYSNEIIGLLKSVNNRTFDAFCESDYCDDFELKRLSCTGDLLNRMRGNAEYFVDSNFGSRLHRDYANARKSFESAAHDAMQDFYRNVYEEMGSGE